MSVIFRLILIRHAHAYERTIWEGSDLERPLIPKGEKIAKKLGKKLAKAISQKKEKLNVLYASEAVRSYNTAKKILKSLPDVSFIKTASINPEMGTKGYLDLIAESQQEGNMFIAIVGHENDLSGVVEHLCGACKIRWKKGGYMILDKIHDEWYLEVMR